MSPTVVQVSGLASVDAQSVWPKGSICVFPTDTVYGFGVRPNDPAAIEKLRRLKQRPAPQPFALHLGRAADVDEYCEPLTPIQRNYMQQWLPGPVTVLLCASLSAPRDAVLNDKVGIRVPGDSGFQSVCAALGPMLGTSVNRKGQTPMVDADRILQTFGNDIALLIEAESPLTNTPSAVIDLTTDPPTVLRGALPNEAAS